MEREDLSQTDNEYDFGERIYDSRISRFFSVDPLARKHPMDAPYIFAGNSPISCIDLDGREKIIISGSENRWWKLTFILPAMKLIKTYREYNKTEAITMLLFKEGYTQKQIDRVTKYAQKKGANVIVVNSANDVVYYINNKSTINNPNGRDNDPITTVNIFSHGLPNQIVFGYGQSDDIVKKYTFDESHVKKLDPKAFKKGAVITSWACRTGAATDGNGDVDPEKSLAQKIANQTGTIIYALQKRSDYEGIIPDDRTFFDKIQEKLGFKETDKTYDQHGGSWDTDSAVDKTNFPTVGSTPGNSPGWTRFEKGKSPEVMK